MTQKNSSGPFHRGPGLFAVNCCFCTAGINEGYPISENGKLVVLTSRGREFRQHAEHTKSSDTTPRLAHAESTEHMVCKPQFRQKQKKITRPSGAATPEEADTRHRRASASSDCSFGDDFAGSSRLCCGRGREGSCFGVCALVCDPSPKAECVPAFARESERGPFVREVENRDEKRLGTALWRQLFGDICGNSFERKAELYRRVFRVAKAVRF